MHSHWIWTEAQARHCGASPPWFSVEANWSQHLTDSPLKNTDRGENCATISIAKDDNVDITLWIHDMQMPSL